MVYFFLGSLLVLFAVIVTCSVIDTTLNIKDYLYWKETQKADEEFYKQVGGNYLDEN